ncbi:helix-turn-helix domain-containing protein [Nocardioides sp.]|uniref:helix-turn-helix transcriptional regulator n=1 Tax=Nocardioides sp. TaxID=35761 RepID=UPI00261A0BBD|nr:helix-turn-helix domain-containing protein [Nocardioides sp.]MCW2737807.1 Helix-turn-helix domain protein [Nocardioides sp.]
MDNVEQTPSMGEVIQRWLANTANAPVSTRASTPGQQQGTAMKEQETVRGGDPDPTARGGLVLIPATMTIAQAADYIGIAKSTLYTWRTRRPGFGPRAVKAGGALRYRRSDLEAWLEAHTEALDLAPELDAEQHDQDSRLDKPAASRAPRSMSRRSGPRSR